jgi:hypothetical protein
MVSLLQLEEQSSVAGPLGHQPRLRNTTTCCQSGEHTVRSQCSAQMAVQHLGQEGMTERSGGGPIP